MVHAHHQDSLARNPWPGTVVPPRPWRPHPDRNFPPRTLVVPPYFARPCADPIFRVERGSLTIFWRNFPPRPRWSTLGGKIPSAYNDSWVCVGLVVMWPNWGFNGSGGQPAYGGQTRLGFGPPRPGRENGSWPGIPGQGILVRGAHQIVTEFSGRVKILAELLDARQKKLPRFLREHLLP